MKRQEAIDVVVAELERNLAVLEADYRKAVVNLNLLRQCAEQDELTRLLRRGAFMTKLQNLLQISAAEGREVCVMMIDVDHFKQVNDGHGHQTGDVVLERVSELVRQFLRQGDLAGRYGGEEIIVAIQAESEMAMGIAERIRMAVQNARLTSTSNVELKVTLSVGVASTHQFKYGADVLIGEADAALYRAKRTGRNKVVQATPAMDSAAPVIFSLEQAVAA